MVLYSLNLCIVYTRGVKKSVGRIVKTGVVNLSLRPPRCSDEARDNKGENDTQHREGEGEPVVSSSISARAIFYPRHTATRVPLSPPENIDCAGDQYPDDRE